METKFGNARINNTGYYQITSRKEGNHGKLLHRLIYEDYHGYLADSDVVHHYDGNPLNNDLSNLIAMDYYEHQSMHNVGEKHPMYGKPGSFTGKHHTQKTKDEISEAMKGNNNAIHYDFPRIVKAGFHRGKQRYGILFEGKFLRTSINIDNLKKYAEENNIELGG